MQSEALCYKTISLFALHRTHWKAPRRITLKLKRSVSQLSLAWKVAPVLVRKKRNHSTYISSTARDNLQEASLVSPSTTAAKDAQATKISISSLMQERKGTLSCRHSVSRTCHLSSFNNQCEEGIQSVPDGFGWDGKLSQTESHLKECNESNKRPLKTRSWHSCAMY